LVLCCIEGRTQEEAARQLGWSLSTVRRRLEHGRRLLHARLLRRGLTLSAALAGPLLAAGPAPASLLRAVLQAASGDGVAALSGRALALAEAFLSGMPTAGLCSVTALLLTLAVLAAGTALTAHQAAALRSPPEGQPSDKRA